MNRKRIILIVLVLAMLMAAIVTALVLLAIGQDHRVLRCQGAQGVNGLSECAERATQGKADSRSHVGNAPSCSRIAAA